MSEFFNKMAGKVIAIEAEKDLVIKKGQMICVANGELQVMDKALFNFMFTNQEPVAEAPAAVKKNRKLKTNYTDHRKRKYGLAVGSQTLNLLVELGQKFDDREFCRSDINGAWKGPENSLFFHLDKMIQTKNAIQTRTEPRDRGKPVRFYRLTYQGRKAAGVLGQKEEKVEEQAA